VIGRVHDFEPACIKAHSHVAVLIYERLVVCRNDHARGPGARGEKRIALTRQIFSALPRCRGTEPVIRHEIDIEWNGEGDGLGERPSELFWQSFVWLIEELPEVQRRFDDVYGPPYVGSVEARHVSDIEPHAQLSRKAGLLPDRE
jgi:hypothetical protein